MTDDHPTIQSPSTSHASQARDGSSKSVRASLMSVLKRLGLVRALRYSSLSVLLRLGLSNCTKLLLSFASCDDKWINQRADRVASVCHFCSFLTPLSFAISSSHIKYSFLRIQLGKVVEAKFQHRSRLLTLLNNADFPCRISENNRLLDLVLLRAKGVNKAHPSRCTQVNM